MIKLLTTFLVLASFADPQTVDDCPSTLTTDSSYLQVHGEYCYGFVLFQKRLYIAAKTDCEAQGGTLAIVKDQETQDYLVDQILHVYNYTYYEKIWIGLDDIAQEGTFMWADGTNLGTGYSNFATYALLAADDCVAMDLSIGGEWRVYHCNPVLSPPIFVSNEYAYVCQYKLNPPAK